MTVTRFAKALLYALFSLFLLWWAVEIVSPMYTGTDFVSAYLRSNLLLFATGCVLVGIGAYTLRGYSRRHPEHRLDSWFFLVTGMIWLVLSVTVILRFGGIDSDNFDVTANAALNLNLIFAGILPVPFLVRGWILSLGGTLSRRERWLAPSAIAVVTVIYLALVVNGRLLHTVSYVM